MTTTSPGWYDDGHGSTRWWDGANWTEHVAPSATGQQAPQDPAALDPAEQPTAVTTPLQPAGQTSAEYQAAGGYVAPGGFAAPGGHVSSGEYVAPPSGVPGADPRPPKPGGSKLWILWVVLGLVVLGAAITIAVVAPIIVSGFTSAIDSSSAPPIDESSEPSVEDAAEDPDEGTASEADRQAAATAVQQYNDAWMTGDCDVYLATTTEELRTAMEVTSCETFALASRDFALGVDDYQTTIGDLESVGSAVAVSTTENFTSLYDDEGNQTDTAIAYEDRYEYIVVRSDGAWVIDDFYAE